MTELEKALYDIGQKEKWNGHDVGKALILTILCEYDEDSRTDRVMDQDLYDKMMDSLSKKETQTFYTYSQICSGLWYARKEALGKYHNLFDFGDESHINNLIGLIHYCCKIFDVTQTPYVVTPDEYAEICDQTIDFCRKKTETIFGLTFSILKDLLENPEGRFKRYNESVEDIVSAIQALTDQEEIDNPLLVEEYLSKYGKGYYILEDGTRSDQVSQEEWEEAVKKDFLKRHTTTINGELTDFDQTYKINKEMIDDECQKIVYLGKDYLKDLYQERRRQIFSPEALKERYADFVRYLYTKAGENVFQDIIQNKIPTFDPLARQLTDFLDNIGESSAQWHFYIDTELPKQPSKFDILCDLIVTEASRSDLQPGDKVKIMSKFKKNFPQVAKAIDAYIKKIIPKANSIKGNQLNKTFFTYGELAEAGLAVYEERNLPRNETMGEYLQSVISTTAENDIEYLKRIRIERSGIAITEGESCEIKLTEDGKKDNYIRELLAYDKTNSPDSIIKDSKFMPKVKETPLSITSYNRLTDSLRFFYAFNAFIEILSDWMDFPELKTACINTEYYEKRITKINGLTFLIPGIMYGSLERKCQRIEGLRELFPIIDIEELKPSTEKKEEFKDLLENIGFQQSYYFSRCDEFIKRYLI